ncbi:MAG: tetratricopeptide repeat-containing sensor histidine kinase [Bacteroidota bacterium]
MNSIIKKIFLLYSLIFLSGFIIAQPKVDSLKNILNHSNVDNKIEIYYQLANSYLDILPDSAIKYSNLGLALIDEKHGLKRKNDCLFVLGSCYENLNKHKIALKYLQQALDGFETENNKRKQIFTNNYIGIIYGKTSYYDKALSSFQKSLMLCSQLKDTIRTCVSLTNIGLVYQDMKDYKTALVNFEKVLDLSTKSKDKLNIAHALNDISNTYAKMADYKMALNYHLKALSICKELNEKRGLAYVTSDIGETYKKLNNLNLALRYYEEAYSISKNFDDKFLNSQILSNIGDLYVSMKSYDKAKEYLDKAEIIAAEIENKETLKDVYESFSKYYSLQNDYKKALDYFKRFKDVNDSIYNKESSDKIAELEVKFDIQEKDKENEILRQKTEIQQLAINKQIYLRNTFIYISIIITLLIIFIFFRYWIKQRANKLLSLKNELINKQNIELEEISKMKDKIFAVIMHDLKNPFNTVVTLVNFMESNYHTMEENQKYSGILSLKKSIFNVNEFLENLLDWLNSKENNLILYKTNFDINSTINSVLKLYIPRAEQKAIELQNHIKSNLFVYGDERMINTVLRNLIDNALKFTFDKGKVDINAIEDKDKITISISDTGVGIDDEDKDKIFKLDSYFSTKGTEYEKGSGLGLILSKEFIEKNEGEIWFESKTDIGSTFYFTIKKGN